MDLSDSDMGPKTIVKWDIVISLVRQRTRGILSNGDMRHFHFLKSTGGTRTPVKGPQPAPGWAAWGVGGGGLAPIATPLGSEPVA